VFDAPTSEVSFAKLGRKSVLLQVKEIFANQPGRPKPIIDAPPPQMRPHRRCAPTAANSGWRGSNHSGAADRNGDGPEQGRGTGLHRFWRRSQHENGVGAVERAAVGLAKAGLTFLQSIAAELESRSSAGRQVQGALSTLFSRHPQTNHPLLSIPLPESFTAERITQAVARFLSALEVPAK
jgi:hypothetical protein